MGPDAEKRIRSRVLRDVAWGPSVETGASGPGYSGAARLTERLSDGERAAQDEAAGGRWRAWRAIASS